MAMTEFDRKFGSSSLLAQRRSAFKLQCLTVATLF